MGDELQVSVGGDVRQVVGKQNNCMQQGGAVQWMMKGKPEKQRATLA